MYIVRSYAEVIREDIKEHSAPDEVTRLPKRKIGQGYGAYVFTGKRHKEAAEDMLQTLESGITLAEEIKLLTDIERKYHVAVEIDYS